LSLILSYQYKHTEAGKLIYCTRTVQEMDKVLEELRELMVYREKEIKKMQEEAGPDHNIKPGNVLGVCLSSRRNMCIHPVVSRYDNPTKVVRLQLAHPSHYPCNSSDHRRHLPPASTVFDFFFLPRMRCAVT
jgi:Rad3-related DNA helicase